MKQRISTSNKGKWSWDMGYKWAKPYICPASQPWEFPGCGRERRTKQSPAHSLSWEPNAECAEVTRKGTGDETEAERSAEICRYPADCWSAHMCEINPGQGENHLKETAVPDAQTWLGILPDYQQNWETSQMMPCRLYTEGFSCRSREWWAPDWALSNKS